MSLEAMIEHIDALSNLKKDIDRLSVDINSTLENLAKVHDEEQEAYYSFPENLQTSEIAMNMWERFLILRIRKEMSLNFWIV